MNSRFFAGDWPISLEEDEVLGPCVHQEKKTRTHTARREATGPKSTLTHGSLGWEIPGLGKSVPNGNGVSLRGRQRLGRMGFEPLLELQTCMS